MLRWIPWMGVAWLFAGCAAAPLIPAASSFLPGGTANADFHSGTVTKLEGANFVVLQTNVTGQCKGFALLGLITLSPARFTTALDQLYGAAGMRPGRAQTLVNLVSERSTSYYILFSIPRVSLRADVVEFIPVPPGNPERNSPSTGAPVPDPAGASIRD